MSYLEDPDHEWQLEDFKPRGLVSDFRHICENLQVTGESGLQVILEGYEGLRLRFPEATPQQCFATSMIWYYG